MQEQEAGGVLAADVPRAPCQRHVHGDAASHLYLDGGVQGGDSPRGGVGFHGEVTPAARGEGCRCRSSCLPPAEQRARCLAGGFAAGDDFPLVAGDTFPRAGFGRVPHLPAAVFMYCFPRPRRQEGGNRDGDRDYYPFHFQLFL